MAESLIARLEQINAEELAAYASGDDDKLQFCFEPPEGWPHCEMVWGSSPTLADLLERRPEFCDLKLTHVWGGVNLLWPFTGDGEWKDQTP